jgi:hypothetical protein
LSVWKGGTGNRYIKPSLTFETESFENILHSARILLKEHRLQVGIRYFKRHLVSLLVCLVLLLDAMTAFPDLHELIHHDANDPGHQCAVTLFAHGQVDSPVVEVAAIIPLAPIEFLPRIPVSISNVLLEPLPPVRGPPVALLPS